MPTPIRPTRSALALALVLTGCGAAEARQDLHGDGAPLLATLASPAGPGGSKLRAGDLAAARTLFEGALAQDPDRLSALNDLAVSYVLDGHADAARRLLDEVVAAGTPAEQQAALVNLGEIYAIDGYSSAAEAYLTSARAVDPTRPEPSYALALLADARGDHAAALAATRTAVEADRGGLARRDLAFLYPEERLHLQALLAEAAGDTALAGARWRELARGRFPALAQVAQRRLEEP